MKYYAFVTFLIVLSCPVLVILFSLATLPRSNPRTDFNHLCLKWRVVTEGCAFWGFEWRPTILRGSKPQKGGVVRHFPAKVANFISVISPAGNIGSIPNFETVIEPHSWLRGWSRITKFLFKMADGSHIAEYWKRYNSPINGPIWMKLRWSHSIMSPICPPCCGCHGNGRCNGALYIQQLWASGGRTREAILMKFDTKQQIRTTMSVTWSNIKIFKI